MRRYYVDQLGNLVGDLNDDHADTARKVLLAKGISPKDYEDLYNQMVKLGYARAVETPKDFHLERPAGVSSSQRDLAHEKHLAGKNVTINNKSFIESRGKSVIDLIADS